MEINLSDIIKNDGSEKSFCETVAIEPVRYMGLEVSFGKAEVRGSVKNISGAVELKAQVDGALSTSCARCMKPVEKTFCAQIAETLLQEGDRREGNDDAVIFEGYSLPLDEIILNSILVSMPVRYLCKDDCMGLCQICGRDLNEGECGCRSEEIDPRFEVLSKLCDK